LNSMCVRREMAEGPPAARSTSAERQPPCCRCCDFAVVGEWLSTSCEFAHDVRRPLRTVAIYPLLTCQHPSWVEAYQAWAVLQLYIGFVTAAVVAVLGLAANMDPRSLCLGLLKDVGLTYLLTHISWFAVLRKNGCVCVFFAWCQCLFGLMFWASMNFTWAMIRLAYSISVVSDLGALGWIPVCFNIIYAVAVCYMGLCCMRIWIEQSVLYAQHAERLEPAQNAAKPEVVAGDAV